jgi:hypothetical protein
MVSIVESRLFRLDDQPIRSRILREKFNGRRSRETRHVSAPRVGSPCARRRPLARRPAFRRPRQRVRARKDLPGAPPRRRESCLRGGISSRAGRSDRRRIAVLYAGIALCRPPPATYENSWNDIRVGARWQSGSERNLGSGWVELWELLAGCRWRIGRIWRWRRAGIVTIVKGGLKESTRRRRPGRRFRVYSRLSRDYLHFIVADTGRCGLKLCTCTSCWCESLLGNVEKRFGVPGVSGCLRSSPMP